MKATIFYFKWDEFIDSEIVYFENENKMNEHKSNMSEWISESSLDRQDVYSKKHKIEVEYSDGKIIEGYVDM